MKQYQNKIVKSLSKIVKDRGVVLSSPILESYNSSFFTLVVLFYKNNKYYLYYNLISKKDDNYYAIKNDSLWPVDNIYDLLNPIFKTQEIIENKYGVELLNNFDPIQRVIEKNLGDDIFKEGYRDNISLDNYNVKIFKDKYNSSIVKSKGESVDFNSFNNMLSHLKDHVKGQDDYLKELCFYFYKTQLFMEGKIKTKPNLMVAGPSGTGKTFGVNSLLKYLKDYTNEDYEFLDFDVSRFTPSGYKGINVNDFLEVLKLKTNNNKKAVFCLMDEFDKLLLSEDDSRKGVVGEFLKLVEGNGISFENKQRNISDLSELENNIDLSNVFFIFAGAFQGFEFDSKESLVQEFEDKVGLTEFMGRVNTFTSTSSFTKESFLEILLGSDSPIKRNMDILKSQGFDIAIDENRFFNQLAKKYHKVPFGARIVNEFGDKILKYAFEQGICGNFVLDIEQMYDNHLKIAS